MADPTPLGALTSTSDLTTYNLGSVVAPAAGLMVVCVCCRTGGGGVTLSSATIGGVAADIRVAGPSNQNGAAIITAVVAPGSNAVSVTWSGGALRCAAYCYLIESYASAVPDDTDIVTTGTGTTTVATLDYPTNGVGIYMQVAGGGVFSVSWSAASEDYDAVTESFLSLATANKIATGSGNTETTTTTSGTARRLLAAVWGPATGGGVAGAAYYRRKIQRAAAI